MRKRQGFALGVLVPAGVAVGAGAPALRTLSTQPFAVHGTRFRPAERITVRLLAAGSVRVHVVRATATGSFTTRFTAVTLDRCQVWLLTARGGRGSDAMLRGTRFRDCAPL